MKATGRLFCSSRTGAWVVLAGLWVMGHGVADGYSPEKAAFSVRFRNEISPYRVMGVFALPRERLNIEALGLLDKRLYRLRISAGWKRQIAPNRWIWQAPSKPGLHSLRLSHLKSRDTIQLNVFVMVPANRIKNGTLNGYQIGRYPVKPLKNLDIYKPPKGFIEVTRENEETLISPHFRIRQFLCKQDGGYPKYVVLRERLLIKLETLLQKVNERGHRAETFTIMSGYRTPYYNQAIGNVRHSRHIYGGAADIFIDERPKDDLMDDLNRDGKIDHRDSSFLYQLIDEFGKSALPATMIGGMGGYKANAFHGPFVHIDVRGFRARWNNYTEKDENQNRAQSRRRIKRTSYRFPTPEHAP